MSKFATINSGTLTYDDGELDSDLFVMSLPTPHIPEKIQLISEEINRFKILEYDDSPYSRGYLDGLEVILESANQYGE